LKTIGVVQTTSTVFHNNITNFRAAFKRSRQNNGSGARQQTNKDDFNDTFDGGLVYVMDSAKRKMANKKEKKKRNKKLLIQQKQMEHWLKHCLQKQMAHLKRTLNDSNVPRFD
jgi:hypothetical protein